MATPQMAPTPQQPLQTQPSPVAPKRWSAWLERWNNLVVAGFTVLMALATLFLWLDTRRQTNINETQYADGKLNDRIDERINSSKKLDQILQEVRDTNASIGKIDGRLHELEGWRIGVQPHIDRLKALPNDKLKNSRSVEVARKAAQDDLEKRRIELNEQSSELAKQKVGQQAEAQRLEEQSSVIAAQLQTIKEQAAELAKQKAAQQAEAQKLEEQNRVVGIQLQTLRQQELALRAKIAADQPDASTRAPAERERLEAAIRAQNEASEQLDAASRALVKARHSSSDLLFDSDHTNLHAIIVATGRLKAAKDALARANAQLSAISLLR